MLQGNVDDTPDTVFMVGLQWEATTLKRCTSWERKHPVPRVLTCTVHAPLWLDSGTLKLCMETARYQDDPAPHRICFGGSYGALIPGMGRSSHASFVYILLFVRIRHLAPPSKVLFFDILPKASEFIRCPLRPLFCSLSLLTVVGWSSPKLQVGVMVACVQSDT